MNFALMYLLAKTPPSASSAARGNLLQKLFDENTLKRLGAPGNIQGLGCRVWNPTLRP